MKRSTLLTVVLAAPLLLAGCDASGPDAPATPALRSTDAPTTMLRTVPQPTPTDLVTMLPADAARPTQDVRDPQPTSAAKGSDFTYTPEANPTPGTPPADAHTQLIGGGPGGLNLPPPPCDPLGDNGNGEPNDCPPGGGGGGGGGTGNGSLNGTTLVTFSRVTISGSTRANVESASYTYTQTSPSVPKVVPYLATAAETYADGVLIGGGQAGGANIAYAIVQGQIGRMPGGTINLCQSSAHSIQNVPSAQIQTFYENDCENWQ